MRLREIGHWAVRDRDQVPRIARESHHDLDGEVGVADYRCAEELRRPRAQDFISRPTDTGRSRKSMSL
jgi:hypothetical protein